jgi:predicted DNA-binding transcriptional regulator AlpA
MRNFTVYIDAQNSGCFYEIIRTEVKAILQEIGQIAKMDKYLTINDTCNYLSISRSTLDQWTKQGYLTKRYVNNNPRYKKSEIDSRILWVQFGKNAA